MTENRKANSFRPYQPRAAVQRHEAATRELAETKSAAAPDAPTGSAVHKPHYESGDAAAQEARAA